MWLAQHVGRDFYDSKLNCDTLVQILEWLIATNQACGNYNGLDAAFAYGCQHHNFENPSSDRAATPFVAPSAQAPQPAHQVPVACRAADKTSPEAQEARKMSFAELRAAVHKTWKSEFLP